MKAVAANWKPADAAVRALRLGAHDYITKTPAAVEAVVLAVARAAEKWHLREENGLGRDPRRAGAGDRRELASHVERARRQLP